MAVLIYGSFINEFIMGKYIDDVIKFKIFSNRVL
jgi:hypothetical protein